MCKWEPIADSDITAFWAPMCNQSRISPTLRRSCELLPSIDPLLDRNPFLVEKISTMLDRGHGGSLHNCRVSHGFHYLRDRTRTEPIEADCCPHHTSTRDVCGPALREGYDRSADLPLRGHHEPQRESRRSSGHQCRENFGPSRSED
jgi:hypothetical protein